MVGVGPEVKTQADALYEDLHFAAPELWMLHITEHIQNAFDDGYETGRDALLARIRDYIEQMPKWDKRSVPGGFHVNRRALLEFLDKLENE